MPNKSFNCKLFPICTDIGCIYRFSKIQVCNYSRIFGNRNFCLTCFCNSRCQDHRTSCHHYCHNHRYHFFHFHIDLPFLLHDNKLLPLYYKAVTIHPLLLSSPRKITKKCTFTNLTLHRTCSLFYHGNTILSKNL